MKHFNKPDLSIELAHFSEKNSFMMILLLAMFILLNQLALSQTFTTSASGTTAWGTASNWVVTNPGGCANQYAAPPPSTTSWWPNCPVDVVITRDMVLSANFVTGGYVRSLTIQNGATLTINNLTLQNNNFAGGGVLNVQGGGTLNTGTITLTNASQLNTFPGGVINATSLSSSNNTDNIITNNGTLNFSGAMEYRGPVTNGGIINAATINDAGAGTASMTNSGQINANTYTFGRPVENTGEINVTTLSGTGSAFSVFTNYGNLNVSGNMTFPSSSILYNNPGGFIVVEGNATFEDNENLVNGTSVAPPPYADMLIAGDLNLLGSGDALIDVNGRLAVYGDVNSSGGGTFLTIADGGQMFVSGNIDLSDGGGNFIDNQNTEDGFMGLYTDGDVTFGGGGGFVGADGYGDQTGSNSTYYDSNDMATDNPDFLAWVASLPGSPLSPPLPVKMLLFNVRKSQDKVLILWETALEINHKQFELYKSYDGLNFQLFKKIVSENPNNKGNQYEIIDEIFTHSSILYYKLIQEDLDGTASEIGVRTVNFDEFENQEVIVYPNPNNGRHCYIEGKLEYIESMKVVDIHGHDIPFYFSKKANDSYFIQFQTPLKSGMYMLVFNENQLRFSKRIIVK